MRLAPHALRRQPIENPLPFSLIQGVVHRLAHVDPEERRHRGIDMTRTHQAGEVPDEQGTDERRDVQAVRIGVGQNAHLVVAQTCKVGAARLRANRQADIADLLGRKQFALIHLPGIQNLATQGQNGLVFTVPGLLRRTTGRVALDQKQLAPFRIGAGAISQLTGQDRARRDFLAQYHLGSLGAALGGENCTLGNLVTRLRVLIEPQGE